MGKIITYSRYCQMHQLCFCLELIESLWSSSSRGMRVYQRWVIDLNSDIPSTSAQCTASLATFVSSSFQNSIAPEFLWFRTCIWVDPIELYGLKISYSCTSVKPGGNCLTRWWVAQGQCSGGCEGDIHKRLRWTGRRMPRIAWPFDVTRAFSAMYCRQYMCRVLVRVC